MPLSLRKPETLLRVENNPILAAQIADDVGPRVLQIIEAATAKPLNRYNIRPGRIFGNIRGKDRYRIVELSGNIIVYKDLKKDKILYENVDDLLSKWNMFNIVEISPVDSILERIKDWLTPFLGGVLVAALISWLLKKLG
jgi:hypothetical protein